MHWSAYEIFSVISGVVLLIGAVIPGVTLKDRLAMVVAGVFFAGYGWYVAGQTSGTYTFSVLIFIIPFAGVGYAIYAVVKSRRDRSNSQ
ncbi:hypothetical protein [Lentzea sp. NPDC004782]|uniref:hypothetical protein n=1 Tax=Lentzea sp. NPDC004782 TaxID=3154458 RepID=UPI0033B066CF